MVNDPIGDMLIQIKNAGMARKRVVVLPFSRTKQSVAAVLVKEGYLESVETQGIYPRQELRLVLRYEEKLPILTDVKRRSKPGLRLYVGKNQIPTVVGGMGIAVLSTPEGIMTGTEAKKKGIGGELLCEVW